MNIQRTVSLRCQKSVGLTYVVDSRMRVNRRLKSSQDFQGSNIIVKAEAEAQQAEALPKPPPKPLPLAERFVVQEIRPDVWCLQGVYQTDQMIKSQVQYRRKAGSAHNAYLVKSPFGNTLIDAPSTVFKDFFISELINITPLEDITHFVITHLAEQSLPVYQAVMARAVQQGVQMQVVLSNPAYVLLRSKLEATEEGAMLLQKLSFEVVKSDDVISKNGDYDIKLLRCSTPRWPDLLVAYVQKQQVIMTATLYSTHVAPIQLEGPTDLAVKSLKKTMKTEKEYQVMRAELNPEADVTDSVGQWKNYYNQWKYFYDCMLQPVARQTKVVLDKLRIQPVSNSSLYVVQRAIRALGGKDVSRDHPAQVIAPMYGPVITSSVAQVIQDYELFTQNSLDLLSSDKIVVFYASAYGNTTAMTMAIARGITKSGMGVESVNLETVSLKDAMAALKDARGFTVGSPTLGGHMPTQVQAVLGAIMKNPYYRDIPCGVYGSYGWSGEAVDEVSRKLTDAGFTQGFSPIKVKFSPTIKDLQVCEESGTDLAQLARQKRKKSAKQRDTAGTAGVSGKERAMGRVVGTMCVLSAADQDASSAMLASWVSQASFNPPGLTVAVKQDRAIESLLNVGNRFVLNIIPQVAERTVARALLKNFKPGEDRYEELENSMDEESKARKLAAANAWMRCKVKDRMSAGDHWICYCVVEDGEVQDSQAISAVHHRKVGTYY